MLLTYARVKKKVIMGYECAKHMISFAIRIHSYYAKPGCRVVSEANSGVSS
jgi:hypothetical protein